MFKTILMTATAALIATAVAAPAHAYVIANGGGVNAIVPNGQFENGGSVNAIVPNGIGDNGTGENGDGVNGHSTQGTSTGAVRFAIDSIELPTQAR